MVKTVCKICKGNGFIMSDRGECAVCPSCDGKIEKAIENKSVLHQTAELKKTLEGMKSEKLRALGYIIRKAFREKLGEMK